MKCDCLVKSKRGYHYYNPAMRRLYIQVTEGKRKFKSVGWYCPNCKKVKLEV